MQRAIFVAQSLTGFYSHCKSATELCFFQRIVNGEPGRHGQAVQHPVVLLMEWEIKLGQELVQVGQMVGLHATELMEETPSHAALDAQVIRLSSFATW